MVRILLLEDDLTIGRITHKKLHQAGYDAHWVTTADAAEEAVKTFAADLVLVDHGLKDGERNGLDVLPVLKERLPCATFWLLSNYSRQQLESRALAAGASRYLHKLETTPA